MSASAAIPDPLLRRAFGQRARPSDLSRTVWDWRPPYLAPVPVLVAGQAPGLRAPVPQRGSAISQRTVMNNAGSLLIRAIPQQN
jgi:hypothetical protein